ncbi:MAG: EAL domain-containing protein [Usitatibacter sp.]
MSATPSTLPATILIVDDEAQNRKVLEALLGPEGHLTITAASGEEALELVERSMPDLILLDIMMPGMDGYQVAKVLKGNPASAHIPIIMLTALVDRAARLAGLNAGAEEFLTKPVDRAELWLRVRNLLRLKAYGDLLADHAAILERQVQARTADLQRFRNAMDATGDAILLVSRKSMRYIEVNTTACRMLGYSREQMFAIDPGQVTGDSAEESGVAYDLLIAGHGTDALKEVQLTCSDGSTIQVEIHRQAQRAGEDWIIVAVMRDITERKEAEKRLHRMAHYDLLTGLPTRTLFQETLASAVSQASKGGWNVAVLCIDLDHFRNVNDTLGHALGDELLVTLARRLVECVRIRDTVGRLGGDEFAVILAVDDNPQLPALTAARIRQALVAPFSLQGSETTLTASIGVSLYPADGSDAETLMRFADTAMYRAKQAGRDTFRFFTAQMNDEALARSALEAALRHALENGEFVLHYQPKVRLGSGRIDGLEALLRWDRPGVGLVPPREFIPCLDETGLIERVGAWAVGEVCRQIAAWIASPVGPMQVSVNVAERQFVGGDLEGDVVKALRDSAIPPDLLELELTESSLMADTERTIGIMRGLKQLGVQISIDDFGTGYSSLPYLRRFPVSQLKIDIAFVRDIASNPDDAAIALAIIRLAHSLQLEVIAEGVETEAQLACLRRLGCDLMQGHLFSAPVPVPEVERLMLDDKRLPLPPDAAKAEPEGVRTLLLVDKDPGVLSSLTYLLRDDGYSILRVSTPEEGFDILALNEVHVVICEQDMPSLSGAEFLERVKDLYPETFRVVLSSQPDPDPIMRGINCGAIHRSYSKPCDSHGLRETLKRALRA